MRNTNAIQLDAIRHMVDGSFWVFLAQLLMVPTGLVTIGYLTRRLELEDYGNYAIAFSLIPWVGYTILAMSGRATTKLVSDTDVWQPVATTSLQFNLLLGLSAMLGILVFADVIAAALGDSALSRYLRLAAFDLPFFVVAGVHMQVLNGRGLFRRRAVTAALRWINRLLLIVLLVELGFGAEGAIMGCVATSVVELAVCRLIGPIPLWSRNRFPLSRLLHFAAPLFVAAVCFRLLWRVDLWLFRALSGSAEESGIYAAATNVIMMAGLFGGATSPVVLSTINRLRRSGRELEAKQLCAQCIRGLLLLLPLAALMAGSSSEVATLLFGVKYASAGSTLAILSLAGFGWLLTMFGNSLIVAAGNPRWMLLGVGPALPFAIIGHFLMIPRFGLTGAAVVTVVTALLCGATCLVVVCHLWKIVPSGRTTFCSVVVAGLIFALGTAWPSPGWLLLVKLPVLTVVIGAALILCGEIGAREFALIRDLLTRRQAINQPAGGTG